MSDRLLRLAIAALALLGLGVAGYLSYTHATSTELICPTSGCARVQQSTYSELGGVPVAYLGVAGYALILATALLGSPRAALAEVTLAIAGAGFAVYLLALQLFAIDAVCVWCLGSDVIIVAIVCLALVRARALRSTLEGRQRRPSSRPSERRGSYL